MKALSLTQPWASLVASGAKKVETRSWSTSYRGPLAIHAAKGFPRWARDFAEKIGLGRLLASLPLGAIIAVVILVDVRRTEEIAPTLSALELLYGDYSAGRWAWMLHDVKALPQPIPYKGALGLFNVILPTEGNYILD